MKFPAANISIKEWDKDDDYLIYILENEFIFTTNNKLYQKYFLNNLFVDSNGDIYKLTDRKLPGFFRQILSFIPNFCKVELIFKKTGNSMTLEQVRQHILNQIKGLESSPINDEWMDKVKNANSYSEIIFG